MSDPTPPIALRELAEAIARQFHETYERLGPSFGWETQESARGKSFDELPQSNRDLMVATITELLEGGAIEAGPSVVDSFRGTDANNAR